MDQVDIFLDMIETEALQNAGSKVKERLFTTPPGTWAKTGIVVMVVGVSFGWIAFPYILEKVVAVVSTFINIFNNYSYTCYKQSSILCSSTVLGMDQNDL